jgi:membrane carboxypeptidase/penicillin-binding protein
VVAVSLYSIAGKTGTAQIYDYEHKVYTHRYNASFLGFAPATNPSLVIVVTVSGTTGQAGFGGSAAGPVFVRLMAAAMNRLGVVRDVPEEVEDLIARKGEKAPAEAPDDEQDTDTVAELSTPLTADEMNAATDGPARPDEVVAVIDGSAPTAPNFVGKTVRDVMQEATAIGIPVDMLGDGLARVQYPPAGTLLTRGEHIRVRFQR